MAACRNVVGLIRRRAPKQRKRQARPNSRQMSTMLRKTSALVITPFIFGSDKCRALLQTGSTQEGAAHSLRGEVVLQLGAHARARPVQEDTLMELGDAKQRADLLRVPAF